MSEIRKDYVTDTWVVISEERAKRPRDFVRPHASVREGTCVFCEGNERLTPPEIYAFRRVSTVPDGPGWWIRTVPNKFPALRIEGKLEKNSRSVFTDITGIGCHEVVIESPEHSKPIALQSHSQVRELIQMYRERVTDLSRDRRFKYILVFENHGSDAGASLEHPHSQIIATPMIPVYVASELRGAENYFTNMGGDCIYDSIIREEIQQAKRIVFDNNSFICIAPFASKYPYELMILPKRHCPSFAECTHDEASDLAVLLQKSLYALYSVLEDPPYNFYIHTSPVNSIGCPYYHWHIEIIPTVSRIAGFEKGTGFYINPISPENATLHLSTALRQQSEGNQIATAGTNFRAPELS